MKDVGTKGKGDVRRNGGEQGAPATWQKGSPCVGWNLSVLKGYR